jgi:hypothetical protein
MKQSRALLTSISGNQGFPEQDIAWLWHRPVNRNTKGPQQSFSAAALG